MRKINAFHIPRSTPDFPLPRREYFLGLFLSALILPLIALAVLNLKAGREQMQRTLVARCTGLTRYSLDSSSACIRIV